MVTLMTLHTAKGLEFPVVFLTGLEDGVFPHLRSLSDRQELEEERRLAYVGITRARRRLYLSRAVTRSAWGQPQYNPPSRFLDELPAELIAGSAPRPRTPPGPAAAAGVGGRRPARPTARSQLRPAVRRKRRSSRSGWASTPRSSPPPASCPRVPSLSRRRPGQPPALRPRPGARRGGTRPARPGPGRLRRPGDLARAPPRPHREAVSSEQHRPAAGGRRLDRGRVSAASERRGKTSPKEPAAARAERAPEAQRQLTTPP